MTEKPLNRVSERLSEYPASPRTSKLNLSSSRRMSKKRPIDTCYPPTVDKGEREVSAADDQSFIEFFSIQLPCRSWCGGSRQIPDKTDEVLILLHIKTQGGIFQADLPHCLQRFPGKEIKQIIGDPQFTDDQQRFIRNSGIEYFQIPYFPGAGIPPGKYCCR